MKKLIIILLLAITSSSFAQYRELAVNGLIEYEKSVNTHAIIKKHMVVDDSRMVQSNIDSYKSRNPQFKILKSSLRFSRISSLFSPLPGYEDPYNVLEGHPYIDQINTVYTDLKLGTFVDQKKVFEKTFLVKDAVRKIDWKITTETREIAGYTCRRANAIIMDSVYVVAFYTGEIPVSAGPESFGGLPGMILEVVLPHENIRWYATKVSLQSSPASDIKVPSKGKIVNHKELVTILNDVLKNRKAYAGIFFKGLTL